MRQTLALVCITILFSACTRHISTLPRLNPVYVKLSQLTDCNTTYSIDENKTVTLALEEARCITNKLKACIKDREKLHIANKALNAQILLSNALIPR